MADPKWLTWALDQARRDLIDLTRRNRLLHASLEGKRPWCNRFNRWSRRGIWKRIFDTLAAKSRDSLYLIDSTIVKAHRAASGAKGGSKSRRSASAAAAAPRKSTPSSTAKAAR